MRCQLIVPILRQGVQFCFIINRDNRDLAFILEGHWSCRHTESICLLEWVSFMILQEVYEIVSNVEASLEEIYNVFILRLDKIKALGIQTELLLKLQGVSKEYGEMSKAGQPKKPRLHQTR